MNIFIVGATSGIGHALWEFYSSQGNNIAVIGRRKSEIDSMIHKKPGKTIGFPCDIADIISFNNAFDKVIDELGQLDLIIICAGIGELNPDLRLDTELETIQVNVAGWTNCIDKAHNLFLKQQHGHLVAITSIGGLQPSPVAPSYSASKAFQINYVKSLQKKSKGTPVTVTEIRPGLIDTRMAKGEGLFWVISLETATNKIIEAIVQKKKTVIISGRWKVINWILKHFT